MGYVSDYHMEHFVYDFYFFFPPYLSSLLLIYLYDSYQMTRLATVRCSNPPNPHRTCTEPEVRCSVQLPSRTKPQWQVQVRDKPEPEPKGHLVLSKVTIGYTYIYYR